MAEPEFLPIKLVIPRNHDYQVPDSGGGGGKKTFGVVDPGTRDSLFRELDHLRAIFGASFATRPDIPAVAKVTLKSEALAKSHRPTGIFNDRTCPIIGGNRFGELFVSVRPDGLNRALAAVYKENQVTTASISAIKDVQPYTERDALRIETADIGRDNSIRVRLFHHASDRLNQAVAKEFFRLTDGFEIEEVKYAEGVIAYSVSGISSETANTIARFVGTQSVSFFPRFLIGTAAPRIIGNVNTNNFPLPDPNVQYPTVGIIDSGTDPSNTTLQAWVVAREDRVPLNRQSHHHGSFVAGLIANGRSLNHSHPEFPNTPCRVVDIAALDAVDGITERELIDTLDFAHAHYPHVKVWNLSLGAADPCDLDDFSPLAAALDQRSHDYGVLYVVAAGNYQTLPLRAWPPNGSIGDMDRISAPAESVKSLTVGSLAHRQTPVTCVREYEPSPFSRRGPGAAYLTKPELAHFGGNCDAAGDCTQVGIISVDGSGNVGEDIGTSFATPLVTAIAGEVYDQLDTPSGTATPSIVKASIIHAAFVANGPQPLPIRHYVGAGCPPSARDILTCRQSSATIIIQAPIQSTPQFGKRPFPMPECLISPSFGMRGEIFMTLLYDGPVDTRFGAEYCRNNVNASLGTTKFDEATGKLKYTRQVPLVTVKGTGAVEEDLIKHGYKWSPLKLYYRKFSRGDGPTDASWRLTLDLLNRSQYTSVGYQDVTLLITIRGAESGLPVYDQLVRGMTRLAWGASDLSIKSRLRLEI